MTYPYFNEAGEPLMDAASMRTEQAIDSDPMTYYCDQCGYCHGGDCYDDEED